MIARRHDWAKQRTFQLARLLDAADLVKASTLPRTVERTFAINKLHDLIREGCARWAEVSAKASSEPLEFAKARLRVLLFTIRHGFEKLPMPRYGKLSTAEVVGVGVGPLLQPVVEQDLDGELDEMSDDHALWVYRALRTEPGGASFCQCRTCGERYRRVTMYPGRRCADCHSKRGGRLLTPAEVSRIKPAFSSQRNPNRAPGRRT